MSFIKKHKDLFFLIIVIVIISYCIFIIIKPQINVKNIELNLTHFNMSDNYNFMYFDDNVSDNNRELYESYINDNIYLLKTINSNDLKIVISGNTVKETGNRLFNSRTYFKNEMVGLYFDKENLIIIKDYCSENIDIQVTPDMIKNATGEYKLFIEDKNNYKLSELYDNQKLIDINNEINSNVFYHELGHFLVNKSQFDLTKFKTFKKAYKEECNIIFPKKVPKNNYIASSIDEYTAECISNYLNYGYVESSNKDLEKNSTNSDKIIGDFINNYN